MQYRYKVIWTAKDGRTNSMMAGDTAAFHIYEELKKSSLIASGQIYNEWTKTTMCSFDKEA